MSLGEKVNLKMERNMISQTLNVCIEFLEDFFLGVVIRLGSEIIGEATEEAVMM